MFGNASASWFHARMGSFFDVVSGSLLVLAPPLFVLLAERWRQRRLVGAEAAGSGETTAGSGWRRAAAVANALAGRGRGQWALGRHAGLVGSVLGGRRPQRRERAPARSARHGGSDGAPARRQRTPGRRGPAPGVRGRRPDRARARRLS